MSNEALCIFLICGVVAFAVVVVLQLMSRWQDDSEEDSNRWLT